jgi:hypothetical protein
MKAIIMLELLSFIITGHKSVVIVLGDRNQGCESAKIFKKCLFAERSIQS